MNNFDEPVKKAETDAEILDALQGGQADTGRDPARGVWRDGARLFPGLL